MYNNTARGQIHHLQHMAARHAEGAPWHEVATIYRNGLRSPSSATHGFRSVGEYVRAACEKTGLSDTDLLRMTRALSKVEDLVVGVPVQYLLSGNLDAVEIALQVATIDPVAGRIALIDLKSGKVTPDGVRLLLDATENRARHRYGAPEVRDSGVHGHWAAADDGLETMEMNRLQVILGLGEMVVEADYSRLSRLAFKAGFGHADHESVGPEDAAPATYLKNIERSERLLLEAFPGGSDRRNVDLICSAMRNAYERGRAQRIERDAVPSMSP